MAVYIEPGILAMQLTYPGTRISTLQELFAFVECSDPSHQIMWNIESKIDAAHPDRTLGVQDFAQKQYAVFAQTPYRGSITVLAPRHLMLRPVPNEHYLQYQSFDWRTLVAMKV